MRKDIYNYVAEKKMRLHSIKASYCTLSTVWKNEVIMINFDTTAAEILNISSIQPLDEEDINILNSIIINFLS